MDLTQTIAPRSDQLNADDLMSGPVTVTITDVTAGNAEQPVNVHLAEFPDRPFKPSKSMRRVMVSAWGKDATAYTGRRMTLYRDPEITFGRDKVGGIRISAMSHIDKRLTLALTVTRGKRAPFTVEPLADQPTDPHARMFDLLNKRGITDPEQQKAGMARILGHDVESPDQLTEDEARRVIASLTGSNA